MGRTPAGWPILKWDAPILPRVYLWVVPDVGAAVHGVWKNDDPCAGWECSSIYLRLSLQLSAMGGHRWVEPQALLDTVL